MDIDSIAKMFHRINVNLNDASRIINEYQTTRDELLVEIKESSEENSLDFHTLINVMNSKEQMPNPLFSDQETILAEYDSQTPTSPDYIPSLIQKTKIN